MKTLEKIAHIIQPYLADDTFFIPEETVSDIIIDFKLEKSFADAVKCVIAWFNNHHLSDCDLETQKPVVGATINLLTLICEKDISTLLTNWVFDDLENNPEL